MRASLWSREKKSKASIAVSVAIHVVVIATLATITFHYPLAGMFDSVEPLKPVAVKYIPLTPRDEPSTGSTRSAASRPTAPVQLPNVSSIPVGVPAPVPPLAPATTAIGAGNSMTVAGGDPGIGFGLRPGIPDGRLATNPSAMVRAPLTEGQKAEQALAAIYQQYLDSARAGMARDAAMRQPGDWSWGGKDGAKWGWDPQGIHLGGITIPNIVLAALPLNIGPSMSPVDVRARDFIRSDLQSHAGLMTEDEFRAAVKRVRDRVDRERRERMEKQKDKKTPPACCG